MAEKKAPPQKHAPWSDPRQQPGVEKSAVNAIRWIAQIASFGTNMLHYAAGLASKVSPAAKKTASMLSAVPGLSIIIDTGLYGLRAYSGKKEHRNRRILMMGIGAATLAVIISNPAAAATAGLLYSAATLGESIYRARRLYQRWQAAKELADWADKELEDPRMIERVEFDPTKSAERRTTLAKDGQIDSNPADIAARHSTTYSAPNELPRAITNDNRYTSLRAEVSKPTSSTSLKNQHMFWHYLDKLEDHFVKDNPEQTRLLKLMEKSHFDGASLEDARTYEKFCKHSLINKGVGIGIAVGMIVGVGVTLVAPPVGISLVALSVGALVVNRFVYKPWFQKNFRTGCASLKNQDMHIVKESGRSLGQRLIDFFTPKKETNTEMAAETDVTHSDAAAAALDTANAHVDSNGATIPPPATSKPNGDTPAWERAQPMERDALVRATIEYGQTSEQLQGISLDAAAEQERAKDNNEAGHSSRSNSFQ